MALLADTAHFIRNSNNSPSCTVMVTLTDTGIPSNVLRLWSSWFPTMFHIEIPPSTQRLQWKPVPVVHEEENKEEVVESQFVVVQQHSNKDKHQETSTSTKKWNGGKDDTRGSVCDCTTE